jgi:transcriptional regulator with XRE-family HTH domain
MDKTPKREINAREQSASVLAAAVRARIVVTRKEQGLTAAAVAQQIGLSRPFYTQLERGMRRLSMVRFLMICDVFKVNPGEMLK